MQAINSKDGGLWGCVPCNSEVTGINDCIASTQATAKTGAISSINCATNYVLLENTQKCLLATSVAANANAFESLQMKIT